jgi:outer membrane protein OmpA-like peptidoglycan-associated protein
LEYSSNGRIAARIEGYIFDKDVQYGQLSLLYRFGKQYRDTHRTVHSGIPIEDSIQPSSLRALKPALAAVENPDDIEHCPEADPQVPTDRNGCALFQGHLEGVTFISGSNVLKESSKIILNGIATGLNAYPQYRFLLSAHTDSVGSKDSNLRLSELRANAVFFYLIAQGVPRSRLEIKAYGEDVPIASNNTQEGRSINRRVDLTIID